MQSRIDITGIPKHLIVTALSNNVGDCPSTADFVKSLLDKAVTPEEKKEFYIRWINTDISGNDFDPLPYDSLYKSLSNGRCKTASQLIEDIRQGKFNAEEQVRQHSVRFIQSYNANMPRILQENEDAEKNEVEEFKKRNDTPRCSMM